MSNVVVTVPLSFDLDTWTADGDAAGEELPENEATPCVSVLLKT